MGHVCSVLAFPEKTGKNRIAQECDKWARSNGSRQEGCDSLPFPIQFLNRTFECREDAEKYLEGTFGKYSEIAVKFEHRPEPKKTKALETLEKRIQDTRKILAELDAPHYASVKQATVKCRNCGSSLATKYCGKTYRNACPVCRGELRPDSVLERIRKKQEDLKSLQEKYRNEKRKEQLKSSAKAEIWWAIACEIHC